MITQEIQVTGMTCEGCKYKVSHLLANINGVENVEVSLETKKVVFQTQKNLSLQFLAKIFEPYPKYQINNIEDLSQPESKEQQKITEKQLSAGFGTYIETYKPIFLIFGYITLVSCLVAVQKGNFSLMLFMNAFMGAFFLVFSFFKMLNLYAFADSYAMYDLVAKQWKGWGYVYPFVELGLGVAFVTNFNPIVTNWITLVVMGVSILGVLESVFNRKKIKCACLGAVFNLPMSTITIIEDGLMIVMSGIMLWLM